MSDDNVADSSIPAEPIRGQPKSGRKWKPVETSRFSALKADKGIRSSWEKKEQLRREKASVKAVSEQIKNERREKFQERKRRRQEHEERRKQNQRKAEVVQVVKNVHKLKRMKKKLLRTLETRDITNVEKS